MNAVEIKAIKLCCMVSESKDSNKGYRFPKNFNWLRHFDDYKGWLKLARMVVKLEKNQRRNSKK